MNKNIQKTEPAYFSQDVADSQRFYLSPKKSFANDLYVVAGGREECALGYEIDRPTFPFYSIEFVAGGRGRLFLGDDEYALNTGIVFSYGPGISHKIYSSKSSPLEKFFVNFTGQKGKSLFEEHLLSGSIFFPSSPIRIFNIFNDITEHGIMHSRNSQKICSLLVELLVLQIADTSLTSNDLGSQAFATYQRCLDLINKKYKELNSNEEIAENCNVDKAYLCRLFKRFGHQTPYQKLTSLKMNSAAELLLEKGKLVKEVAYEVGFNDQFHFSRSFKRVFDVSPKEFIKLHKG
jgi:AraC-like DNA-binding protein